MANKLTNKKTRVTNVVFCFLLLFVQMTMADRSRKDGSSIQKLLKKLNKPAVKSIKSPDGDIIDCVDILKQPAFDHPKLKNHKIRMRPSSYPEGMIIEGSNNVPSKSPPIAQLWHQSGSCPEGTIPIRRIRKEDMLRDRSIRQFGKKNLQTIRLPSDAGGQRVNEYASVFVKGEKYYGGKAAMNVWNPKVQQDVEWSVSAIWVVNDVDKENLNAIEVGWQVNQYLYGDNRTRLFTFWTDDNDKSTGCYDLRCSGFVQLNAGIAVGSTLEPLSVYNDTNSQYDIQIMIWKDKSNGDWWMQYGDKVMGYWSSSLFTHLSDSATFIRWGGQIVNSATNGQHSTTQMGSGQFPREHFGKASFFKNLNGDNQMVPADTIFNQVDRSTCYDVQTGRTDGWGRFFYFGGPGRNPNCP
ncbi:uncharacterized protein LOC129314148 [Prosopis cineraria]|uniref:uncharacterized protein LOC129314148 n=1 Tax=Prosopis cineraria TaxID=364024 RepID=UPI00240FE07D|nr:uncharacterized protein LOC129314148 [Prosopis cineraria]